MRSIETIESELEAATVALAEHRDALERERRTFETHAQGFARAWMPEEARRVVSMHPAVTARLSDEEVAALKRDVAVAADAASGSTVAHAQDWWHLGEAEPGAPGPHHTSVASLYTFGRGSAPSRLERAIRALVSGLARVLAKYGFPAASGVDGSATIYRDGSLRFTAELRESAERYAARLPDAARCREQLLSLRQELTQAQARRRWDQA